MAKLNAEEFMKSVQTIIGDRDDDEALKFIEDCKDTITGEKDDWKAKYDEVVKEKDELDKSWRAKYKERFCLCLCHCLILVLMSKNVLCTLLSMICQGLLSP